MTLVRTAAKLTAALGGDFSPGGSLRERDVEMAQIGVRAIGGSTKRKK